MKNEARTNQDIQLNDREQIQYLLGNPPSWMMRYGISVTAGIFLLATALSYFIHYPDTVDARVVLTTLHPPIRIMSSSGGRVAELLVFDKQPVEKGQVLAVMENTALWRDVLRLESWLEKSDRQSLPTGLQLGELQHEYSVYSQHWNDLDYFARHNGVLDRVGYLQRQTSTLENLGESLQKQMETMREEFRLATRAFQRQEQLHSNRLISDKEWEASEAQFLVQKRQLENAEAGQLQNRIQIRQFESQINDLLQNKSDSQNDKQLTLDEDLQRLRSAIAVWKQTYLVTAPIGGQVSLSRIWSAQQWINAGEEVLAVVPPPAAAENSGQIIGRAKVQALHSGKIAPGQRGILRLDGYPPQQYGTVESSVSGMSLLPQKEDKETEYEVDVYLPDSLVTSYGKVIPFRQEMTGHLRIITEDRSVIDRIFDHLQDLLRNR